VSERSGDLSASTRVTGREFEAIAQHTGSAYLRYSFARGTEQEIRFLWGALGLSKGQRVLDVGCGPGRHSTLLRSLGIDVVGLDLSERFLLEAGSGDWVRGDARVLPFAGGVFDAVICLCQGGFGLLGGEDERVIGEIARVLRSGGRMAVSAFSSYFAVRFLEAGDDFDADRGVNHELAEVRDAAGQTKSFDLWTTCFTPRELRLIARGAGVAVTALWAVAPGAYAERPPDLDHPEFLLIGEV
jgi:SAM-dependent methyltransferase